MFIHLGEGTQRDESDLKSGNKRVWPYKSGGVVVLDGLCVAEGLQDGVSLQQLLLQLALARHTGASRQPRPARLLDRTVSRKGNCSSATHIG